MNTNTIQIDIKPTEMPDWFQMNLYINGDCYKSFIPTTTLYYMLKEKIVEQTYGIRQENGRKVRFEYPEGVDGAGVKYTSALMKVIDSNP